MDGNFLMIVIPLVAGYLLDLLVGDPEWLPHPIRLFGTAIAKWEEVLNKGTYRLLKGALLTIALCLLTFIFFHILQRLLLNIDKLAYYVFASIYVFYGLANKSLLLEGRKVFDTLKNQGIGAGRNRLALIVGRQTSTLNENQIRTAVFETLSENLNDGVIAPLFYYAIGGVPAMMVYKMINTLDSMIGYKSSRYFYFGKFAARLDDVVNYIPARLTALLMVLVTFSKRGLIYIFRYGHQHASPNSGYPEAALAGILQCRFGGPNTYHGEVVVKPYIGDTPREIKHEEFKKVMYVNHAVTAVMIMLIIIFLYLRYY